MEGDAKRLNGNATEYIQRSLIFKKNYHRFSTDSVRRRSAEALFDSRPSDASTAKRSHYPTIITAKVRAKQSSAVAISTIRVVFPQTRESTKNIANF